MDSGPSGAATRYYSALFQAGTAAGLGDRVLLERFAERATPTTGGRGRLRGAGRAPRADGAARLPRRAGRSARGRGRLPGDVPGPGEPGAVDPAGGFGRVVAARRGLAGGQPRPVAGGPAAAPRAEARGDDRSNRSRSEPAANRPPDDVDRVLHEEIGRLPEKYRRPVVLCYLEGLTHDQAADQLGWPVGTVRRRLAGARDRLRGRLTRRGAARLPCDPPAGLRDRVRPGVERAAVTVPSGLADATVRGALRVGLGQAASVGIVSAEAVALMKGVLQTMTTTKLIAMTAAVLTVCLVTTGVGLLAAPRARPEPGRSGASAVKGQEKPGPANAGQIARRPARRAAAAVRGRHRSESEDRQGRRWAPPRGRPRGRRTWQAQGDRGQLLELAIRHPRTNAAEQALIWLVSHISVSDRNSHKAWELLARDYARSDRIKQVLSRHSSSSTGPPRPSRISSATASEQNPYREIRGLACYWLARDPPDPGAAPADLGFQPPGSADQLWRERFGPQDLDRVLKQDPKALEHQAARLYDRMIAEFPFVANNDRALRRPPLILGRSAVHSPRSPGFTSTTFAGSRRQAGPRDRGRSTSTAGR